jgi:hypothetical protein
VSQKVNGSRSATEVPYLSLNGIKKYKNHKLTDHNESKKLDAFLDLENESNNGSESESDNE